MFLIDCRNWFSRAVFISFVIRFQKTKGYKRSVDSPSLPLNSLTNCYIHYSIRVISEMCNRFQKYQAGKFPYTKILHNLFSVGVFSLVLILLGLVRTLQSSKTPHSRCNLLCSVQHVVLQVISDGWSNLQLDKFAT